MSTLYSIAALSAFIILLIYITDFKWKSFITNPYVSLFLIGLSARLALSFLQWEYPNDMSCFKGWANTIFSDGISQFYFPADPSAFRDYPPGYMYILYIIGFIRSVLGLESDSYFFRLLIKTPSIIADLVMGLFIFKLAYRKMSLRASWLLALGFILNPVLILNSVIWGQVDSFYTIFILLSIYYLTQKHYYKGFGLFALAILIKPQAFMFTPVYMYAAYYVLKEHNFSLKGFIEVCKYALFSFGLLLYLILPFIRGLDITPIIKLYIGTLSSYAKASVNAYNFHTLTGANWEALDTPLWFTTHEAVGFSCLFLIVIFSIYLLFRNNTKANFYFVAALINILTFMFSVKMHERYMFPAIALLTAAYVYKRDKRLLLLNAFFSITLFLNCADVLYMVHNGNTKDLIRDSSLSISGVNLLLTGFLIYWSVKCFLRNEEEEPEDIANNPCAGLLPLNEKRTPLPSEARRPFDKRDALLAGGLTIVYAIIAFYNLGDTAAPQTVWSAGKNDRIMVDMGEAVEINKVQYLVGARDKRPFRLDTSEDLINWRNGEDIIAEKPFLWEETELDLNTRYIQITALDDELMLSEMAFRDGGGNIITPVLINSAGKELFDEQQLVPDTSTYMNSSYFDEIYHPRTAYEFIHGLRVYENTHPPLGKTIISLGIRAFGMTPFGWRFAGTLFGALMVPLMYLFGKKMFGSSFWAFFTAFIFTFDFMHYTQTRLATIDTYVTFFIILMYYFMYDYYSKSFYDTRLSRTLAPLGLSGLFMGLAIASKWQGVYAVAGLAFIFFYTVYVRWREYVYAGKQPADMAQPAQEATVYQHIRKVFPGNMAVTIGCCFVFFIAVPLAIYCLSYIPYLGCPGEGSWLERILENQESMFSYHSGLESEHPYASPWWKWPLMIRPVFLYSKTIAEGIVAGISTFGNPAVWWTAIVAFFYSIHALSKRFDRRLVFLIAAFLSQFLPWVLIPRTTYLYHYFPSVPFLVMMVAYFFKYYVKNKRVTILYCGLVLVLFVMFYPVLSGMPVAKDYVTGFLRWISSWQLVI